MAKIFSALVFADLLILTGAAVLGFTVAGTTLFAEHFALAMFGVILSTLIHVVVFTYFTATAKMIGQAVHIGGLDQQPLQQVKEFKRRVSKHLAVASASLMIVAIMGAITDASADWAMWHLAAAALAIFTNAWAFYAEYDCIVQNAKLMDVVFSEYTAQQTA